MEVNKENITEEDVKITVEDTVEDSKDTVEDCLEDCEGTDKESKKKRDKRINNHFGKGTLNNTLKELDMNSRRGNSMVNPYADMSKDYVGKDVLIANMPPIFDEIVKGVSVSAICRKLGVSRQTWYNLLYENKQFQSMLDEAQLYQAETVKQSLVSKCQDQRVIKEKVLANGKKVLYEEYIPSDFQAIKFYLLNKMPEEFREKQEIVFTKTSIEVMIDDNDFIVDVEGENVEE